MLMNKENRTDKDTKQLFVYIRKVNSVGDSCMIARKT